MAPISNINKISRRFRAKIRFSTHDIPCFWHGSTPCLRGMIERHYFEYTRHLSPCNASACMPGSICAVLLSYSELQSMGQLRITMGQNHNGPESQGARITRGQNHKGPESQGVRSSQGARIMHNGPESQGAIITRGQNHNGPESQGARITRGQNHNGPESQGARIMHNGPESQGARITRGHNHKGP